MSKTRNLWSWIARHMGGGDHALTLTEQEVHQQTVALLYSLINLCPVCKREFSDHSYALVAMAVFGKGKAKSAYDLLNEVSKRHWNEIISYQNWDGSADNLLVYAIRCSSNQIALLIIEDPYVLGASEQLIQCEPLDTEESERLRSAIPEEKWMLLN